MITDAGIFVNESEPFLQTLDALKTAGFARAVVFSDMKGDTTLNGIRVSGRTAKELTATSKRVNKSTILMVDVGDNSFNRTALTTKNVKLLAGLDALPKAGFDHITAKMAHDKGALFHTDAVQACGKIPVDVKDSGVDYLTMSGHKIYAPKGIGALYIKKGAPIDAFVRGGHQEHGLRAGTYNAPVIAAMGCAAENAKKELDSYEKHTRALRNQLRDGLLQKIPNILVNGHPEKVLPNTLDVSFPGAEGEAILLHLDLLGVSVSTGSACASGSLEPSHVLMATGLGPELAHGSIRFSLGKYSTKEDVDYILEKFPPVIEMLRKMSTLQQA